MPLYLRAWRDALGLSLTSAAAKIGCHFTTLQKWEKGGRAVGSEELSRIARAYGVEEIALFFHPQDRQAADRARRALLILRTMDAAAAEKWLELAEAMQAPRALPAPDKIDAPAK